VTKLGLAITPADDGNPPEGPVPDEAAPGLPDPARSSHDTGNCPVGAAPADLDGARIALFLDVDGTLLEIAPHPDAVTVPARLPGDLADLERRLQGAVALVSGRPIATLDRLFAPARLSASGQHGAEIRHGIDLPGDYLTARRLSGRLRADLQGVIAYFPGTFVEDKGASLAIHHRLSGAAEADLLTALATFLRPFADHDLELVTGRRVAEIKPRGCDKGLAIRQFMRRPPFLGRIPVFIADDEIDRPGFQAALALGGLAYSVGEALPGLSGTFRDPAAVRRWLACLGR
jgi:trehalose 6-phosphate phosphatase